MSGPTPTRTAEGSTVTLPKVWSDALAEFTANQIPIHLIDLHTLRLVSRSDVARHYRPVLAAYLQRHPSRRNAPDRHDVAHTIFKTVRYAIFSHRWLADGEPMYQDMPLVRTFADVLTQDDEVAIAQSLAVRVPDASTRAGLYKLLLFCSKARSYRCRFAWSDTCCIHKESSAELDESIRAMFRWYRNAHICIAHLASSVVLDDVPADEWFTRGWTLQELLAPEHVKFYNRAWTAFTEAKSDKDRRNGWLPESEQNPIWQAILAVTHIPSTRLGYFTPGAFDVAQRMSWAADRRTTRIEDEAYALVGIFGISMPAQYGEGKFAFQRLITALLRHVRSYELLVWTGPASQYSAALPASIEGYLAAREAGVCLSVPNSFGDPSLVLTPKGLQVEVLLVPVQCKEEADDSDEETNSSDQGGSVTSSQDTHSSPDSDDDGLGVRFLLDDPDYQSIGPRRLYWFHFTDPDGIFKPLSVRGRGPILILGLDDLVHVGSHQYAFAILDYHRDLARGPGCVYVPYEQRSRHLAFVLYRDDSGEAWGKLETDTLVYVEVEANRVFEGKTVDICL